MRPLLFRLDAEAAHEMTLAGLARVSRSRVSLDAIAQVLCADLSPWPVALAGIALRNPIVLAAGLDKDAVAIPAWHALGFGGCEIGTVTPRPQAGNARPRLFRLVDDGGLVNRMGFNSAGAAAVREHLVRGRAAVGDGSDFGVGVNVGKNKDTPLDRAADDYVAAIAVLRDGADWITVNVSSPNTPDLRRLQQPTAVAHLVAAAVAEASAGARRVPVLVKLAPDWEHPDELHATVEAALQGGAAGFVATNTTLQRPLSLRSSHALQAGGLSGAPLRELAFDVMRQVVASCQGRAAVVAAGGITEPADVRERLAAGAAAVQVYSALVFEGPGLPGRWVRDGAHGR
ncbi:MAG: quinone-dependent dihydroorotate dehydrogenase [Myxococcales bacterium]|nr:quinone-dependent dihydroorotate dehydrogenase [Myxococcales bacterium]